MEKNMLLAIGLSVAILVTFQYFSPSTPPPVTKTDMAKEVGVKGPVNEKPVAAESVAPISSPKPIRVPETTTVPEKLVTVENDLNVFVFSTRGATIRSVELKKYKGNDGRHIVLKGDEILPPMSMGTDDGFDFSRANFRVDKESLKMLSGPDTASLVFEYSSGENTIRRTYSFKGNEYGFDLKDEVRGIGHYWITLGKDFGIYERDATAHSGPVVLKDAERLEFVAGKVKEAKDFREGVKWIAQEDKYFFSSIVPKTKIDEAKVWDKNDAALSGLKMPAGDNSYFVYIGPKDQDILKPFGFGLEHIIDFGFFSIIARPLFWVLKMIYGISHNYGFAIILLTILVRIPFIPLINKSQQSMKKLQDIQPRMAEIKEKYKNDPQKLQQETMEIYKKHKVNPVGGCLPMLLQIPVFFALYKILFMAIELRGAPFMLWIKDLAGPDTLFGHIPSSIPMIGGFALGPLPIVMGITMVIQQKMTPSSADPAQQKIMMIMPVVFTFMFLNFSSGLVLYWLVNNLLSIGQQFFVNRKMKNQPA